MVSSLAAIGRNIPSFGFSGAGFLTCYHLGAAECLIKNGLLLPSGALPLNTTTPILTGVSGGALVATAVSLGITPEDGMKATLEIAQRTRQMGGFLDHLRPGFSLIDQVAEAITVLVRDVDEELALRRTDYGRLLHIGLTDSRAFPQFRRNRDAYLYVDHYESLEEILSACILSSYIPGLTGPMAHKTFERNGAVRRANKVLISMTERGSIKNARGIPLRKIDNSWIGQDAIGHDLVDFQNNILFWDGGLANVFPAINLDTCIVTPFTGFFTNPTISPSSSPNTPQSIEAHNDYSRPALCLENLRTIRYIAFSSESLALESWFEQGYNDANAFLNHKRVASDFLATKLQSIAAEAMVKGMTEVSPRPTEGIL